MSADRIDGTVKWFDEKTFYGFILGDDGKEYFLHISEIKPKASPADGRRVRFTPGQNDRGPRAKNVELLAVE